MGSTKGCSSQVTGSPKIQTWTGAGFNRASSGLFARFRIWPKWWLYGASPLMLDVGENVRPIDDAALGSREALTRGFKFALRIPHAPA